MNTSDTKPSKAGPDSIHERRSANAAHKQAKASHVLEQKKNGVSSEKQTWSELMSADALSRLPEVAGYVARHRDELAVRERLTELRCVHVQAMAKEELYSRLPSLGLDEEARQFLETFHTRQEELLKELEEVVSEVDTLRGVLTPRLPDDTLLKLVLDKLEGNETALDADNANSGHVFGILEEVRSSEGSEHQIRSTLRGKHAWFIPHFKIWFREWRTAWKGDLAVYQAIRRWKQASRKEDNNGASDVLDISLSISESGIRNAEGELMDLTWRKCVIDTACPANCINEIKLEGIKHKIAPYQGRQLKGLGWWAVRPKGTVTLTFKLTGEEKKEIYEATFLVLSQRLKPRFDCLLGYPWLRENGFKLVQGQEGHVVIG